MTSKPVRIIGLTNDGRLLLSAIAASAMLVHVSIAQHVQILWSEPATYLSLFQHKCGVALVGCSLWLLLELLGVFDTDSNKRDSYPGRPGRTGRRVVFGSRVLR